MSSLFESGVVRAGVFFAAAFLIASALGALLGDLQGGMRTGAWIGLVMAVLGYAFVRPAREENAAEKSGEDPESVTSDGPGGEGG